MRAEVWFSHLPQNGRLILARVHGAKVARGVIVDVGVQPLGCSERHTLKRELQPCAEPGYFLLAFGLPP